MTIVKAAMVIISLAGLISCQTFDRRYSAVGFDVISCSGTSGYSFKNKEEIISVESQVALNGLVAAAVRDSTIKPRAIDFHAKQVIGIFAGTKPSSGYAIAIRGIAQDESSITIRYDAIEPARGCEVDMSLTYPYCIFAMNKTDREVKFVKTVRKTCGV